MTDTLFCPEQIIEAITPQHLEEALGLFFSAVASPTDCLKYRPRTPDAKSPTLSLFQSKITRL